MIGIGVVLGTIALCYANVNVENELMEIRTILNRQEKEMIALRNVNRALRGDVRKMAMEIDTLKNRDNPRLKKNEEFTIAQDDDIKGNNSSNKIITRIVSDQVTFKGEMERHRSMRLSPEPVAFYAYMSASEPNPSLHHALIFDEVKTNVGGGYNQFSGMFTAPSPGLYVITWTIYTGDHGQTAFFIYVNHNVFGATFGETDNNQNDFDSDSGSMVVNLNAHDNVYIRTSRACSTYVISDSSRRTTFAGWRLN